MNNGFQIMVIRLLRVILIVLTNRYPELEKQSAEWLRYNKGYID